MSEDFDVLLSQTAYSRMTIFVLHIWYNNKKKKRAFFYMSWVALRPLFSKKPEPSEGQSWRIIIQRGGEHTLHQKIIQHSFILGILNGLYYIVDKLVKALVTVLLVTAICTSANKLQLLLRNRASAQSAAGGGREQQKSFSGPEIRILHADFELTCCVVSPLCAWRSEDCVQNF